jgi:hypothetical protein
MRGYATTEVTIITNHSIIEVQLSHTQLQATTSYKTKLNQPKIPNEWQNK